MTALMLAAEGGHKECVELLLRVESIKINYQDYKFGNTALMHAAGKGREAARLRVHGKKRSVSTRRSGRA